MSRLFCGYWWDLNAHEDHGSDFMFTPHGRRTSAIPFSSCTLLSILRQARKISKFLCTPKSIRLHYGDIHQHYSSYASNQLQPHEHSTFRGRDYDATIHFRNIHKFQKQWAIAKRL